MKQCWKYIYSGYNSANINMINDVNYLDQCIENYYTGILRIYLWKPIAVSLGRNQTDRNINCEYCKENNIDIVTRPTGGRAVLHQGDITYCFIVNSSYIEEGHSIAKSYKHISGALIQGLRRMGLIEAYIASSEKTYTNSEACMAVSTGADLEYNGKKIAGSAQLRKNGFILQHGSILINQDFKLASKVFNVDPGMLNCLNLNEILVNKISIEEIAENLKKGFEEYFSIFFSVE
ncbi:MAG: lipoate--protein ligase family protein [Cyanobacteriota bacterium]